MPVAGWDDALAADPGPGLAAGGTPLLEEGRGRWAKAEYRNPTGSFKDRGAALVVAAARAAGVSRLAADSSGNAALALAALSGREGIGCRVFVPEACPAGRVERLRAHGAEVVAVAGPRSAVAEACLDHIEAGGVWDAGHARNPWFLEGTRTAAWELWSDLRGSAPAAVFAAAGNATLLLGLHRGFEDLLSAGRIDRMPTLVGVQVAGAAPLAAAWGLGREDADMAGRVGETGRLARGLMVDAPPLAARIVESLEASGGAIQVAAEAEIAAAMSDLARRGHPPDPCSAVAWAAVVRHGGPGPVVAMLSGGGA